MLSVSKKYISLVLLFVFLAACRQQQPARQTHELLNAQLWVQKSAEYKASCLQTYTLAKRMLDAALQDKNSSAALEQKGAYGNLPPAVILDVDETVLDNSAYETKLIKSNTFYSSSSWKAWCEQSKAQAIPGAVNFCLYASKKGVTVFYVTNRKENVKEATRQNLKALGFPLLSEKETLITRSSNSDKGPRREKIAQEYRILLLVGDNAGDFASAFTHASTTVRDSLTQVYKDYWGTKWIILPNPLYGDWEGALFDYEYKLPYMEKLKRKYRQLRD